MAVANIKKRYFDRVIDKILENILGYWLLITDYWLLITDCPVVTVDKYLGSLFRVDEPLPVILWTPKNIAKNPSPFTFSV